jgi:hypothetical protein
VLAATVVIMKAEELEQHGPWSKACISYAGRQGLEAHQAKLKEKAVARHSTIRAVAVEHPDWSRRQLAAHLGVPPDTVKRALCDGAAA